jgi:hypothetical protein
MTTESTPIERERARTDERGFTYTRWTAGRHTHVSDSEDFTPEHDRGSGYSRECGWCYLNASHSEREDTRLTR